MTPREKTYVMRYLFLLGEIRSLIKEWREEIPRLKSPLTKNQRAFHAKELEDKLFFITQKAEQLFYEEIK